MKATEKELKILREGGKRLATILHELSMHIVPGVSTDTLNGEALELAHRYGGEPAFLGYTPGGASRPYPAAICMSVNEEVVHGVPNEHPKVLREGDVVTLDMGLVHNGLITDMAITVPVGKVDVETARLISAAREALTVAIAAARIKCTTGDIGAVVEATAKRHGFSTPHELGGHGVGRSVHEEPFIPNFGKPGTGVRFEEGMVLAIEPIIIAGKGDIVLASDGFTYVTKDGTRAAQFEHTVVVTDGNPEILTQEA
ncbi:type I methionyl aminopeptidase [Candidatus Wolfebacteria bacterium]|nr:type I methionyl aminopeptidase [Candidatus Wolfebacteria bacterium]